MRDTTQKNIFEFGLQHVLLSLFDVIDVDEKDQVHLLVFVIDWVDDALNFFGVDLYSESCLFLNMPVLINKL